MSGVPQEVSVLKYKYRLPLLLMTMACGCGYLYAVLDVPTLEFHQLQHIALPSSSFQTRRGFVTVLRWLESLNSREDLLVLGQLLTQAQLQSLSSAKQGEPSFTTQVASAATTEVLVHLCKLGLQCSLALFLFRRRVLTKNQTIPTLCLCVLSWVCWKMAQTCVYEVLSPYHSSANTAPPSSRTKAAFRDEMAASFLNALFVARYTSVCITNLIFGRAYQVYFCEPLPTKWKRVPAYLGSKNLVLATLFFATAGVSAVSVSSPALRSLCEAATHIEALSLVIAFGHFVCLHFIANHEGERTCASSKR
ncbi:hypothetical protein PC129_g13896 [Phytophthora cactorum]|uniref:Transmembrane protein n=1 Tax=Phytophthora cactorum TaxID=29920 RepID=A0A329RSP5_9STRA|nr:hypothetical protein Pcac1_g927 [Phytophthora cactorum]KAG2811531.1 hypothetical protein PC111_g15206 [Phytophthora cactorum]KAG2837050.1 hypothetical protein PC112_g5071 [Phytophthora cactorum]KAG2852499.1 hypothetical protein PC113_g14972 [Phytophthora cactorum]KAG2906878.1 hypothetical protein PC115_g14126 [Phytophthora cactorum]